MAVLEIVHDDDVIVAHRVASVPLDGSDFPLRLLGASLEESEQLGAVESIVLELP